METYIDGICCILRSKEVKRKENRATRARVNPMTPPLILNDHTWVLQGGRLGPLPVYYISPNDPHITHQNRKFNRHSFVLMGYAMAFLFI